MPSKFNTAPQSLEPSLRTFCTLRTGHYGAAQHCLPYPPGVTMGWGVCQAQRASSRRNSMKCYGCDGETFLDGIRQNSNSHQTTIASLWAAHQCADIGCAVRTSALPLSRSRHCQRSKYHEGLDVLLRAEGKPAPCKAPLSIASRCLQHWVLDWLAS